ncbi:hypothetical protein JCM8547_000911 [Rhodosporidiobolus lusitaniae]
MDMSGMGEVLYSTYSACLLGDRNGTYPDGTPGNGTFEYGHYVPSSDEMMACQSGTEPWAGSVKYALWTMYLVGGFFGVCAVFNHLDFFAKFERSVGLRPAFTWPSKLTALLRSIDQGRQNTYLPPLGSTLVSIGLLLFSFVVSFGIHPWYRAPNFGSPPLGLRSEWIATALIVWIIATGVKRNALSYLSGISYPRLLDLHKTFGWVCCIFAIVHTAAMMIQAHKSGAPWHVTLASSAVSYGWAAWGALVSLIWLCVMSLGPIRRLCHEFFYVMHMACVLLFFVFMYFHCDNLLMSWPLLHGAVVILGTALVYRFVVTFVQTFGFFEPSQAVVTLLEDGAIGIKVTVESRLFDWSGGDHVFLRFASPSLFPWQSHPFTISNLPEPALLTRYASSTLSNSGDLEKQPSPSSLPVLSSATSPATSPATGPRAVSLVFRPHSGLTSRLYSRLLSFSTTQSLTLPVYLDGPYSSSPSSLSSISSSTSILVVAGGTGLSFALPLVLAAVGGTATTAPSARVRKVEVVWATRHVGCLDWYREGVEQLKIVTKEAGVQLSFTLHVTRGDARVEKAVKEEEIGVVGQEKCEKHGAFEGFHVVDGRPDGTALVLEATKNAVGDRLAVVSCGPPLLALAVRDTVANHQLEIVRGRSSLEAVELVEEVYA